MRPDNKVEWDPDIPRVCLKSGKPLVRFTLFSVAVVFLKHILVPHLSKSPFKVPDYAMSFVKGGSSK